jgi:hypothetical protein
VTRSRMTGAGHIRVSARSVTSDFHRVSKAPYFQHGYG